MEKSKEMNDIIDQHVIITKDSLRPPKKKIKTKSGRSYRESITEKDDSKDGLDTPEEGGGIYSTQCTGLDSQICQSDMCNGGKSNIMKRNWEMWGQDEKDDFFQALGDCGKDFDKILLYMNKQRRKVKSEETKNKEQIRHLYYRTWNNIMKRLKLPPEKDPKTASIRECHYLICYGELRRKGITGFGSKAMKQLQDLVTTGCTVVRFRTRNIRLRAPIRAMKKLYPKLNPASEVIFPKYLTMEFLPRSMQSFNLVQTYGFNPRVRLSNISLHTKLSDIFESFTKRYVDLNGGNLQLYLYPVLPPEYSVKSLNADIVKAKQLAEKLEKKLDAPICLNNPSGTLKQNHSTDERTFTLSGSSSIEANNKEVFPKVFGKQISLCSDIDEKKEFPGFWNEESSQGLAMNVLYLALGKRDTLKFKYDWRKNNTSTYKFGKDSLYWLMNMARYELKRTNRSKQNIEKKLEKYDNTGPKAKISNYQAAKVMKTIGNKDEGFAIPFRPRPGRKKIVNMNSQQSVPQNRYLAPRITSANKDVVAVNLNLLPNHAGINNLDGAQLQLGMSGDIAGNLFPRVSGTQAVSPVLVHEADSTCQGLNTQLHMQDGDMIPSLNDCHEMITEEVLEEGQAEEHYSSLNKFLESARQKISEGKILMSPRGLKDWDRSLSSCSDLSEFKKIMVDNNRFLKHNEDPPSQSLLVSKQSNPTSCSTPYLTKATTDLSSITEKDQTSRNFDWLNGDSTDVSLSGFINICEKVRAEERRQKSASNENRESVDGFSSILFDTDNTLKMTKRLFGDCLPAGSQVLSVSDNQVLSVSDNHHLNNETHTVISKTVDPTLPMFHSGDSSHGILDSLTFELSNHDKT